MVGSLRIILFSMLFVFNARAAFVDTVSVDNFPTVQQVSGDLTVSQSGDWTIESISNPVAVTQSGSWTVGRNWLLTSADVTSAVQSGSWNVGIVGTPTVTVDNFPAVQPISAASLPLPTGASTAANQSTQIALATSSDASLASIDVKTPALGQANMAGSQPVVIANNQTTIPVSVSSVPLPSGAATEATLATRASEATLSTLNGKVIAVDTDDVTITSALPAGTNSIGQVTANAGTNLNTSALNLESTQSAINSKIPSNLTVTATRLLVDGSGVTQPVSAAALPLPSGASTSALQSTGNASLASIDTKLTAPLAVTGPLTDAQLRATSVPVTATISGTPNVAVTSSALPTGAATSALQTTGNASLATIDSSTASLNTKIPTLAANSGSLFVTGGDTAGIFNSGRVLTVQGAGIGSVAMPVTVGSLPLPSGAATETTLAAINTKTPTPTQRTPTFTVTSGSGTIAAGAKSVSFYNSGLVSATVLGSSLGRGESLNIEAPGQDTLAAISYVATGTTLKILEVR